MKLKNQEYYETKIDKFKKLKKVFQKASGLVVVSLFGTLIWIIWSDDWRINLQIVATQATLLLLTGFFIKTCKRALKHYKSKISNDPLQGSE